MKKLSLIMIALAAISSEAMAGSANAKFLASAKVNPSCVISATNVDFGEFTPATSGSLPASASITSTCTNSTTYNLGISAGSSNSVAARAMVGSSGNKDTLKYNLYTDAGTTSVWGETIGTDTVGLTGAGVAQTSTVYAKLDLNQYIKPDKYTDTLIVTVSY